METKEIKKTRTRKNLKLVNEGEISDNKSSKKNLDDNIELVFSAESKEVLESGVISRETIRSVQKKVSAVTKEIQMIGQGIGITIDVRMVFHARRFK